MHRQVRATYTITTGVFSNIYLLDIIKVCVNIIINQFNMDMKRPFYSLFLFFLGLNDDQIHPPMPSFFMGAL